MSDRDELKLEDALEWKWMWKNQRNGNSTDCDRTKTTGDCGLYKLFV